MIYDEFAFNQNSRLTEAQNADLALWLHVLAQGLRDFAEDMVRVTDHDKPPQEPSYWFWSRVNAPGSFEWLCDLVNTHPDRMRKQVLGRWRELAPRVGKTISSVDSRGHKTLDRT